MSKTLPAPEAGVAQACGAPPPSSPVADGDPLRALASAAAAEICAEIERLSGLQRRAGRARTLRLAAGDLWRSPLAEDQVRRSAYLAAAEDLSWGRKPLEVWLEQMGRPVGCEDRARVRARLPPATATTQAAARTAARILKRRHLHEARDLLEAARSLPDQLRLAAARQTAASDDPRLDLLPVQRAVMRASAEMLEREADWLSAPLSFRALGSLGASWWRGVRGGVLPEPTTW